LCTYPEEYWAVVFCQMTLEGYGWGFLLKTKEKRQGDKAYL
ncbi:hypothetical protein AB205_0049260, partial [Aquarana catesbeiana]